MVIDGSSQPVYLFFPIGMPGDVSRNEERLPVPRDAVRGRVNGAVQRHGQCIGRENLGSLCKRRVS